MDKRTLLGVSAVVVATVAGFALQRESVDTASGAASTVATLESEANATMVSALQSARSTGFDFAARNWRERADTSSSVRLGRASDRLPSAPGRSTMSSRICAVSRR